ncbi:hypothetical protein [Streptomyces sp. MNU89]|uniref:DUF7848 domain-containing protein n=1 Tax=Streptomyces sp. MNU89 TaxID=2560025 RepID=UPI001E46D78A|nr:hypothetical protein [Streptomyces sp. MNU89]MCC9739720.1 hypothetical protein [Streptomyces sp. MNU89]
MTRSIFRRIRWTMARETAREAPEMVHELECTTCHAESSPADGFETVRDWAFAHTSGNPAHRGYRETVTRFWRMTPTDGECR